MVFNLISSKPTLVRQTVKTHITVFVISWPQSLKPMIMPVIYISLGVDCMTFVTILSEIVAMTLSACWRLSRIVCSPVTMVNWIKVYGQQCPVCWSMVWYVLKPRYWTLCLADHYTDSCGGLGYLKGVDLCSLKYNMARRIGFARSARIVTTNNKYWCHSQQEHFYQAFW